MRKLYQEPVMTVLLMTEQDVFMTTSIEGTINDRDWFSEGGMGA